MKDIHERLNDIRKKMAGMIVSRVAGHGSVQRPGSSIDRTRIIMEGSTVLVYGDRGCAVYELTEPASFKRVAEYDPAYFAGKCSASATGRGGQAWHSDRARSTLAEILREHCKPEMREAAMQQAEQWDAFGNWYAMLQFFEQCGPEYGLEVPDEGVEWMGIAITDEVLWHLNAVKMVAAAGGAA